MSRSSRETLPDVREWSRGPPRCPGVVRRPSRKFGRPFQKFERPAQRSGNGRDTLPNVPERWEALPDVWEALPVVREWSGVPPGCLGVVRRPS